MIPLFLLSPETQNRIKREEEQKAEDNKKFYEAVLVPHANDWTPDFRWKDLNHGRFCFKASTYNPASEPLFDTPPVHLDSAAMKGVLPTDIRSPQFECDGDATRAWVYRRAILPRGEKLSIASGNRHGHVYFDGDVSFPILYEHRSWVTWKSPLFVWMSLTPMEVFTQRPGVRHCSGRVCIGGLGLGWFLKEVHKKRSVTEIVVVERNRALLDWFGQEMCGALSKVKVVCADVFEYLEERHSGFDKIALDVFEGYGGNNEEYDARIYSLFRRHRCPREKVWCWGAANIGENPETKGQFWY
jgi:hypothetical protein